MANENLVYLVQDRLHIVTGAGTAVKHYYYEEPSVFNREEHEEIFGELGTPICTMTELVQALRSIKDARQ